MPIDLNRQEFRKLIERRFLPYVIKPARFVASEWRAGAARSEAPLAVIASGASYESSLTNPLAAAVSEALIDSQLSDVGWLYQFSDQASQQLSEIGAAPFVTPRLAQAAEAELIIVPLSRPSDIFSALKSLSRAGLAFGKNSQSKLIAITDSKNCLESLRQEVFSEIFDQVYALDVFHNAITKIRNNSGVLADLLGSEFTDHAEQLYFPQYPPGPIVEVSHNRACFRFSNSSTRLKQTNDTDSSDQWTTAGECLGHAIIDSGQTEFQLERCYAAPSRVDIAKLLDMISAQLTSERYGVTLIDLSPDQLGGFLPGALRRYRRARVDIKLLSLSETVNRSLGRSFEISALIEGIKSLQRYESIQVQLTVSLGFPGDSAIERDETIGMHRTLSQALNPRSGLKIRFVHFTPLISGANSGSAVREMQEVEELFETIRRKKSRGISLTLLDSAPHVFDMLIERGAFGSLAKLTEFAQDPRGIVKRNSADMTDMLRPYLSYFSAQSTQSQNPPPDPAGHIQPAISAPITDSAPDFSGQPTDDDSAFGRGRKRSGATGIAAPTKTRVRFTWTVNSQARFLSHLDNLRALEGALLRSRLPLSYTQGARPRPKVSFGPPLPVGFSSDCELFDAFFEVEPTKDQVERLCRSLPEGFKIIRHETIYTKALSILEEVSAADYVVCLPEEQPQPELSARLELALGSQGLVFQRKSKNGIKEVDLRPGVFDTQIITGEKERPQRLKLTLALTDTFTIRPEDFLQAANIIEPGQAPELSVQRLKFYFGRMVAFRRPPVNVSKPTVLEDSLSEEV